MVIFRKLIAVNAGVLAIAMAAALATLVHGGPTSETSLKAAGSRAIDTPCDSQQPGGIGMLGRLAPGHSARELQAQGYRVYSAVARTPGQKPTDADRIVEIGRQVQSGQPTELAVLRLNPALSAVGPVLAQSLDPTLRSCNYKLDNRPAALRLRGKAETAMIQAGLISRAELASDSTIFLVSDNPLDSHQVLVTADVAGPTIPDPFETTSNLRSFVPIIAVINKESGTVVQVGFGAWYTQ